MFLHTLGEEGALRPSDQVGKGSGLQSFGFRTAPPFPRVRIYTQLGSQEFTSGARIYLGGVEAARAALAPGAKTPITFIVDCRHNPHTGRHGFCGRPSVNPRGDADLSLEIRQSPALLIWSNLWGAWLLHPHGFGRSPHTRRRDVMPKDPKWVSEGMCRNHIAIAATRLSEKIDVKLCHDQYDELISVRLGKIRRTMTPVVGELQARCVFPRGPEPGCAPHKFGPQFPPTRFLLTGVVFRMPYPEHPPGHLPW